MQRQTTSILFALAALFTAHVSASTPTHPSGLGGTIRFEENRGQTGSAVRFFARAPRHTLYATDRDVAFELWGARETSSIVRLSFPGAKDSARWVSGGNPVGEISYYVGTDRSKWVHAASQYSTLTWTRLYPGIDAVFYAKDGQIEYDLVLAPGADPAAVRLRFKADAPAVLDSRGEIAVATDAGTLRQRAPRIFQDTSEGRKEIHGGFVAAKQANEFTLEIDAYDQSIPLVVDPVLEYAAFIGGENDDEVIATGEGFYAGHTRSVAFEGAPAARRRTRDIFVAPITKSSNAPLIWYRTVIFGGSGDDQLTSGTAAILAGNLAYVFGGFTDSQDFYSHDSRYPNQFAGGTADGFVAICRESGSNLSVETKLIGGTGDDRVTAVATTTSSVYAAGITDSIDLPVNRGFQTTLAGGKDGFVWVYSPYSSLPPAEQLTYLGGTSDDFANAIQVSSGVVYVAGETRSADFPLTGDNAGERRGNSDAFITRLQSTDTGLSLYTSRLFGGSGEDRIHQIVLGTVSESGVSTSTLSVVGTTTSSDLPQVNALQEAFGGESDAFIARMNMADGSLLFSSFIGGSGADQGLALAQDAYMDLLVGGSTRSSDLPVQEAVQPQSGGGEDGFFAFIDHFYRYQGLTYFGGIGDDRVNAVAVAANGTRIAGTTTSPELPAGPRNTAKPTPYGGVDGFIAEIGTGYIAGPERVYAGKDYVSSFTLSSALAGPATRFDLTVTSSDPTRVRFVQNGISVDSITLPRSSTQWWVTIEGLDDSGEVTLTATAPGHTPKQIQVVFLPAVAVLSPRTDQTILTWSKSLTVGAYFGLWNAEANRLEANAQRRAGADPIHFNWSLSGEGVVGMTVNANTVTLTPLSAGTATLSLACDAVPIWSNSSLTITVKRPSLNVRDIWLGKDIQARLSMQFGMVDRGYFFPVSNSSSYVPRGEFTVRSSDPSRLLLSADGKARGNEAITVGLVTQGSVPYLEVYAQALSSDGDAEILISSPELDHDYVIPVRLGKPYLNLKRSDTYTETFQIVAGQEGRLSLDLDVEGRPDTAYASYSLRPGAKALKTTIASSDPAIAKPSEPTIDLESSRTVSISGVAPGEADISMTTDNVAIPGRGVVRAFVVPPTGPYISTLAPILLGKDLQYGHQLRVYLGADAMATFSVDDPSLALVATNDQPQGAKQVQAKVDRNGEVWFWIYGLASSGETQFRVKIPGVGEASTSVTLMPSGFAFDKESLTHSFYEPPYLPPKLQTYVLDDVTGIPLFLSSLRPGKDVTIQLRTEGDAVSPKQSMATLKSGSTDGASVGYDIRNLGVARIVFDTPDGFSPATRRGSLTVNVIESKISISPTPVAARDAVTRVSVGIAGSPNGVPITISSANPSLLQVGTDINSPTNSIVVNGSQPVYLFGSADSGLVELTATASNSETRSVEVPLRPLEITFQNLYSTPLKLFTQAPPTSVTLGLAVQGVSGADVVAMKPGLAPIRVEAQPTEPSIVRVEPSAVTLPYVQGGAYPALMISGVGPGNAEIKVAAAGGYPAGEKSIPVAVARQKLVVEPVVIGKDTQRAIGIRPESSSGIVENHILTLTSAAPDRVLLSRTSDQAGAASIQIPLAAGSSGSASFYAQALAGEGEVDVRISSDAFEDSIAKVTLSRSGFVFRQQDYQFALKESRTGLVDLMTESPAGSNSWTYAGGSVRPGAPPVSIPVTVQPPTNVTMHPNPIVVAPGKSYAEFELRGTSVGKTNVVLGIPGGFSDPGQPRRTATVIVNPDPISFGCSTQIQLGKDEVIECSVGARQGLRITAESSDSSRLRVAFGANSAGVASTSKVQTGQYAEKIYIHGIGSEGKATLTFTAESHKPLSIEITLVPTTFTLSQASSTPTRIAKGSSSYWNVVFSRALPGSSSYYTIKLRPGASPVTIDIKSSNPVVATPSVPSLQFVSGDSSKGFQINGNAVGNAVITIGSVPGYAEPGNNAIAVEVR